MTTGAVPRFRPLGVGQLLDQAIRIYRRNFFKFIGIVAVIEIPISVLSLLFSFLTMSGMLAELQDSQRLRPVDPFAFFDAGYFIGIAGGCLLSIVSITLILGVAMAALSRATLDSYMGRPTGLIDAYRKIAGYIPRLLGAMAIALVIVVVLFIWVAVPCIGWFSGAGMAMFFMTAILYLVAPIIVFEKQPPLHAIRRAWDLARRRFWWMVGFLSILYLFSMLITVGPTLLLSWVSQALTMDALRSGNLALISVLRAVGQSLLSTVGGLLYAPLQMICMTLVYLDLRMRTEGLDLLLQAEGTSNDIDDLLVRVPPPADTGLLTWNEFGAFVLLSLGIIVVFIASYAVVMGLFVTAMGLGGGALGGF